MTPALKVSAGPSSSRDGSLAVLRVNHDVSGLFAIVNDHFLGRATVRIKGFTGRDGDGKADDEPRAPPLSDPESGYFDEAAHKGLTWSIQIQGRFREEQDTDSVVFGNTFERPIRERLPYGTSIALKFVKYIDPSLEQDIYADKPWAWSPLLATMNYVRATKAESPIPDQPTDADLDSLLSPWPEHGVSEDLTPLLLLQPTHGISYLESMRDNSSARRTHLSHRENRETLKIPKDYVLDLEFANGFIDFNTLSIRLPVVGGAFSLTRYWDGQPVRYVCRTRDGSKTFFEFVFDIADEELLHSVGRSPDTA